MLAFKLLEKLHPGVLFYDPFCPIFCPYAAKQGLSLRRFINYTDASLMEVSRCWI
jgi:hypothetical protein